ncbi:Tachykinin-like peptides receptor 99D [Exaiptasia diaphana]|nr:Tachykinin-like peptides receptor 99D [Exaiptasia diaphana]
MHTRTNYFIVNMACADLIINLGFGPYIVKYNFNLFAWFPGLFGQITCVAHQLIVFVGGACSVFSLVLITFDRLMAVLRPLKYKTYLPSSKYLIILTWLLSLGLSSSFIFSVTCLPILPNGVTYCLPKKVDHLLSAMIFSFLVVLVTVIALSIAVGYKLCTRKVPGEAGQHTADRTSRKVTYMILCVVLAFTVTWSPLNVIHYAIPKDKNLDVIVIHIIASITYSFAQLNGLFNLAVYFIFSENYRNAFKSLFIRVKSIFRRNTPIVHTCNNEQQFAQYTGGMINLAALKSSYQCKEYQFECNDGFCVDDDKSCDGIKNDCSDGLVETGSTCPTYQLNFTCFDGSSIDVSKLCNERPDCGPNEEDEMRCEQNGICGFDSGHCGMKNEGWRSNAPNKNFYKILHDHSFEEGGSYYIALPKNRSQFAVSTLSRQWNKRKPHCMQFWYIVGALSSLKVCHLNRSETICPWSKYGSFIEEKNEKRKEWTFGQVEIPGNLLNGTVNSSQLNCC